MLILCWLFPCYEHFHFWCWDLKLYLSSFISLLIQRSWWNQLFPLFDSRFVREIDFGVLNSPFETNKWYFLPHLIIALHSKAWTRLIYEPNKFERLQTSWALSFHEKFGLFVGVIRLWYPLIILYGTFVVSFSLNHLSLN